MPVKYFCLTLPCLGVFTDSLGATCSAPRVRRRSGRRRRVCDGFDKSMDAARGPLKYVCGVSGSVWGYSFQGWLWSTRLSTITAVREVGDVVDGPYCPCTHLIFFLCDACFYEKGKHVAFTDTDHRFAAAGSVTDAELRLYVNRKQRPGSSTGPANYVTSQTNDARASALSFGPPFTTPLLLDGTVAIWHH